MQAGRTGCGARAGSPAGGANPVPGVVACRSRGRCWPWSGR